MTTPRRPVLAHIPPMPIFDVQLRRREVVGGVLWFAVAQYFVMMLVVQSAWTAPYSIVINAISDLGAVNCGVFEGRDVCSPWHVASNVSWALAGVCIFLGAVLLWRVLARDVIGRLGLGLMAICGLAEFIVGLNPEDASALHVPAAMVAILGGLLSIVLLGVSLARRPEWRGIGRTGVIFGIVGVTSVIAWMSIQPSNLFGLFERIAAYPILLWLVLAGIAVLRRARNEKAARHGTNARIRGDK